MSLPIQNDTMLTTDLTNNNLIIDNIIESIRFSKSKIQSVINIEYPCSICKTEVRNNDKAILCCSCEMWVHITCNGISVNEYKKRMKKNRENPDLVDSDEWICLNCLVTERSKIFPFGMINDHLLETINSLDSIKLTELVPEFEVISETIKINNLNLNDIDENTPHQINCKYYNVEDIPKFSSNLDSFNIFHSNVNGYSSHFEDLHELLVNLKIGFDCICISETSLQIDDIIPINQKFKDYKPFFSPTKTGKGGVLIFTKESYKAIEREDLKISDVEFEAVWIEINNPKNKNIVIGCTYRHPHANNMDDYSVYLTKCLTKLNRENKEVYITGDFNTDLLKYEENNKIRDFYNLMTSNGFLPQITLPTRITPDSMTVIDNIYSNTFKNEIQSGNILIQIADHLAQIAMINKPRIKIENNTNMYKRDYKNLNEESFLDDISIQQWDNNSNDPNEMFNDFLWRLESSVNRHAPLRKLSKKEYKLKSKPWISVFIQRKIRHRNELFSRKKKNPTDEYVAQAYNRFRNSVNRDIIKAKRNYYSTYFENCKLNMKKTWKGIKEIINNKPNPVIQISQLKVNNALTDNPEAISNAFNDFFVNVGPNVDKEIPVIPIAPSAFLKNRIDLDFIPTPTSVDEVLALILGLDDNKSSGPSSIPTKLLKISAPLIVPTLVKIINVSFTTGIFPDNLKLAKVIPIFKSGSKYEVNNYRPISLLSVFSKILEKLMHIRVYKYLEIHQVIFESQFGFQQGKSTYHSLIEIVEKIRNSIENKNYGCGIFIDLKKAFDTVNHNILLLKLEHYGIRGNILDWFKSYLTNRSQFVYCNNKNSKIKNISCGVPQGSVLGPLLFLLYINDLPNISSKLKFFLFADDTNIFFESKNLESLQHIVNYELKKLSTWLNVNRLALNISKTNFVIFAAKNKPIKNVTLLINNKAIAQKDYVKYLGILIDSKLNFNYHITAISKKISRSIGLLYKLRYYVNAKTLMMVYYSLVYPFLTYAVAVWGSASDTSLKSLHILQKKVTRLITFNDLFVDQPGPLVHTKPLFKELKILTIFDIFKLEVSKFVYDCLHFTNPIQFNIYYKSCSSFYKTTSNNKQKLFKPIVRTTIYGLKSIKYNGVLIWNEIPLDIRLSVSKSVFIYKLKKLLLDLEIN